MPGLAGERLSLGRLTSLDRTEVLLTIGEISATLAGFAGVVILFLRRDAGRWVAADVSRFAVMLACSLGALVFALLPLPFISAAVSEATTWGTCSAVLAVFLASIVGVGVWANIRFDRGTFNPYLVVLVIGGSFVATVLLVLNILGVGFHRSFTGYLIGLSWLVAQAAIYFARLVYLGVRERLSR
jgi:hypothetical protein